MIRYLRIYSLFVKTSVQLFMAHRFNFLMGAVANLLWTVSQLVALKYLFEKIPSFSGWTLADLVLLLGFGQIFIYASYSIFDLNLDKLLEKILTGRFDRLLTKPVNIQFMASFEEFSVITLLPMITAVAPLIIYGLWGRHNLLMTDLVLALVVIILGVVILYFLNLSIAGLTFFFEDVQALKEFLVMRTADFSRIPLTVFPKLVQTALTFVIPIAFVAFYPTQIVRQEAAVVPVLMLEIILLLFFSQLSRLVWQAGLKRYSGIG